MLNRLVAKFQIFTLGVTATVTSWHPCQLVNMTHTNTSEVDAN